MNSVSDRAAIYIAFWNRHEPYRAVAVHLVVPVDEVPGPSLARGAVGKKHSRISRRVFQGPEQGLGVRVIVGDVRTAEGRHDPEPLHGPSVTLDSRRNGAAAGLPADTE